MTRAVGFAGSVFHWFVSTTGFRVWQRLSQVRGGVLVAGVAYSAFFSLLPLVALAFTVFGLVLGSRTDLQVDLAKYLGDTLPNVFKATPEAPGLVYPPDLVAQVTNRGTLTGTGVVAIVVLVWSGLSWVTALRLGIRAAMHLSVHDFNPVVAKIRDFGIAIVLGAAVLVSAIVSVTAQSATEQMLSGFGISSNLDGRILTRLLVALPVLALDTGIFWLQYRLLAASPLPGGPVRWGSLAAAVGFGILKLASGEVLPRLVTGSAFVTVFGLSITVLIWFNLLARVTLLGAAWAGLRAEREMGEEWQWTYREYDGNDPLSDRYNGAARPAGGAPTAAAPAPARAVAPAPAWSSVLDDPAGPSVRAQDRVVLAAGVVLGATAAVGVRAVVSAATSLRRVGRRDTLVP